MSKRKLTNAPQEASFPQEFSRKRRNVSDRKKHTLDSDEEDDHDEAEDEMDADEIEGEEEGVSRQVEGVRMTAFNMKEEMEEGHFDKNGHFIWNNETEIRDNWLDNVDWHKVSSEHESKYTLVESERGLGEESGEDSASDEEEGEKFDEIGTYKKMIEFMKPKETVNKTIRRLGGDNTKLSSVERLKRKKAGTLNTSQDVTDMTECANTILTKTGNMDIYQETFEQITRKIESKNKPPAASTTKAAEPVLDMYADDFDEKEKEKIGTRSTNNSDDNNKTDKDENKLQERNVEENDEDKFAALPSSSEVKWEFKRDQNKDEIEGPFDTRQMIKWAEEGYFKTGVWVRKCGENSNFYSSNRIDFELYE